MSTFIDRQGQDVDGEIESYDVVGGHRRITVLTPSGMRVSMPLEEVTVVVA